MTLSGHLLSLLTISTVPALQHREAVLHAFPHFSVLFRIPEGGAGSLGTVRSDKKGVFLSLFVAFWSLLSPFGHLLVTFVTFNPARDYPAVERKGVFSSEKTPSRCCQILAPCSAILGEAEKSVTFGHFLMLFRHFCPFLVTFVTFCAPLVHFVENSTTGCEEMDSTRGTESDGK